MVKSTFTYWPVLVCTLSQDISIGDVDAIEAVTLEAFAKREKHVLIFDGRRVQTRPDALVRQKMAKFTNDTRDESKLWTLGTAIVVESALLRSVITAVHWVSPPSVPVEAVSTFDAAIDRARAWLQPAMLSIGVDAAAALRQYGVQTASGGPES